jgi:hypothetical protein
MGLPFRDCAPAGIGMIGPSGIAAARRRSRAGAELAAENARERAPAHGAGDSKKNAAHFLGSAEMKFRLKAHASHIVLRDCVTGSVQTHEMITGSRPTNARTPKTIRLTWPKTSLFLPRCRPIWFKRRPINIVYIGGLFQSNSSRPHSRRGWNWSGFCGDEQV